MATVQESRFQCPNCGALYELVCVEADTVSVDRGLTCLSCGAPLQARQGRFALKYFLLERSHSATPRRAVGTRKTEVPDPQCRALSQDRST
jgi:ssDNA-binding Zn-finger/Zn-ribbon topoisomerase 1